MKAWMIFLGLSALFSLGCCTNPNSCGTNGYGFANARVPPPGTSSYSTASNPVYPAATVPAPGMTPTITAPTMTIPSNTNLPVLPGATPVGPPGTTVGSSGVPAPYGYQTSTSTAINDPTRMPAVDATGIRAPSGFAQAGSAAGYSPIAIAGNLEYGANPQIVGANPNGYPPGYSGAMPANNANYVLAQASTKPLESDPNYRLGWRPVEGGTAPTQR